jgi:hypothetical protein
MSTVDVWWIGRVKRSKRTRKKLGVQLGNDAGSGLLNMGALNRAPRAEFQTWKPHS